MSVVFASLGISLDGFVAGPDNALGDGGGRIHGAYVMGRRMFDEGEVGWPDPPPFRAPVFVLTHDSREP
jgi:dihydrofolate reductase